jgi:hypothetical protein
MKELDKLTVALYINNHNLRRFSPAEEEPPVLTVLQSGWAPEPVWTLWRSRESNISCPARCLSRPHGHRSDKNGVYSTSHLFFTWVQSSVVSSMGACSYQPHPSAFRVVLRELSSRGNRSSLSKLAEHLWTWLEFQPSSNLGCSTRYLQNLLWFSLLIPGEC